MKAYRRTRNIELLILVGCIIATFLILEEFDATEKFYEYSRAHEEFELDELLLTVAASFFYLAIYTFRRYREVTRVYRTSVTDPLVNALNRSGGMQLLDNIQSDKRTNKQGSTLILFDIDNFKSINDTFGHEVGDIVLQEIADICQAQLRDSDSLIRWGGEEFLVLCKNTPLQEGELLAERLRAAIDNFTFPQVEDVTASFGVVEIDMRLPMKDSISTADKRLYASKHAGKNRVTGSDQNTLA